jgi:hypothetical protein
MFQINAALQQNYFKDHNYSLDGFPIGDFASNSWANESDRI